MNMFNVSFLLSFLFISVNTDIYDEVRNSRNFSGKVVLVTGSSSGIGEGTAKLFSSLGASVVITERNQTNVKRVAEETQKLSPHGLKPLEVVADLTKDEDRVHLINEAINKFGQIDVLVNNAGGLLFTLVNDSDILTKFDNSFNVDVRASLHLIHLSLPYLQKSKGTIINISSILAYKPAKGFLTYSMAKTSLEMLTKVLSVELGSYGIRVNAIAPGYVGSDAERLTIEQQNKIISIIPLQRRGTAIDIASGIVFLASSDAQYITGTSLIIDGGIQYNSREIFS